MIDSKPDRQPAEMAGGKFRWTNCGVLTVVPPRVILALVLGVALVLMWEPMHDDSATTDEANFLGAGYTYWQGQRYFLNVDHPPLMQLWSAFPLLFLDVKMPPETREFFDEIFASYEERWNHKWVDRKVGPVPTEDFYRYPLIETGTFGNRLMYGRQNDADALLFWGRFMQALVTLATGLLVFLWARSLSNVAGGLLALVAWCFNPVALAYGHLVITDPGIALMLPLAAWMFARFLESPGVRTASLAGLTLGAALLTKFTAIILLPTFGVMLALAWWRGCSIREVPIRKFIGNLLLVGGVAWAAVLLLYAPHWSPAPPLAAEDAQRLRVPEWFIGMRWLLIPREYFKGLTLVLLHVDRGHHSYFLGQWLDKGFWYYYPIAILIKTPVALLMLILIASVLALRRVRQWRFGEATPLIAAFVFLGCAMTNNATIGIRHILPIYPLLAVVIGVEFGRMNLRRQVIGWILAAWLVATAFLAHSDYIAYFNEIVGGPAHGQDYLVDSDFGQGFKRLKRWMGQNRIAHIYLDSTGTPAQIHYLGIPCDLVTATQASKLGEGYLIVSASRLVSPDYSWLRATRKPVARIGHTLFVYAMSGSSAGHDDSHTEPISSSQRGM